MKKNLILSVIVIILFSVVFLTHKEYELSMIKFPLISLFFLFLGEGLIYLIEYILEKKYPYNEWYPYVFGVLIAFTLNCVFVVILILISFQNNDITKIVYLQSITIILHFLFFCLTKLYESAKK